MGQLSGYKVALMENAAAGNGAAKFWPGGKGIFTAVATFGGGSVKLQVKALDGSTGTFVDVTSASLSAAGMVAFELPPGEIRAVGATASAIYAYAILNT